MAKIAIITDTDASLPAGLANASGIVQVPICVHFGDDTYRSGVDIDDVQLFERVDREGQLPTTSAPPTGAFLEEFQTAFTKGADAIVCLTVSGEVSATYAAAVAAKDMLPERPIEVVDTRSLSLGQGFMVLEAAQAAEEGLRPEQIIQRVSGMEDRTFLFAALSTLKYLAMSGRVGHVAAGMANLMNVKPILTIQDGKLDLLERVRTKTKAWERLIQLVEEVTADKVILRMGIVHVAVEDEARKFQSMLYERLECPPTVTMAELTPGLSVHSGAGLVGVALVQILPL